MPIDCINQAAIHYHVPATLILSVMKTEGGHNGLARKNKNGTYDYGVMQINSIWLNKLEPYGFTSADLQYNPCKSVEVGTWILSQSLANGASLKRGIGDYHSHTPNLNKQYHQKVNYFYHNIHQAIKE